MEYNFTNIEKKWQRFWAEKKTFKAGSDRSMPKYYVLDMFPYPSGAGLHVGHPLGYIASDIYSRFKRLQGFNVLHPIGYDAYGLPAEQYAIQTGQHPAITTEQNIKRYREQLLKIGFSFDWDREVKTCDPEYYKWTQWAFLEMFKHWYNNKTDRAEPIDELISEFEKNGNKDIDAACSETPEFTAEKWMSKTEREKQEILLNYRIAYLADTMVNWCPELGTVLANDEVTIPESAEDSGTLSQGIVSKRGGYPVYQKTMKQWCLRITAYAQRLLEGLDRIDWSDSLKEIQRYWIGRSEGAALKFEIRNSKSEIFVFTTRPDTIFGCTFMVLAPESELVDMVTTDEYRSKVDEYIERTKKRTERDRLADVKTVSGQFTGGYAEHPFTKEPLPIWISDYVLAGYGTGAIMAVPAHDSRDYAFAKYFDLPIIEVVTGGDISKESYDAKTGKMVNSDFINGLDVQEAIKKTIDEIEKQGLGERKVNYRLRDAIFSRQRYWGEPFPVYYKDNVPYPLNEEDLPLELPEVDAYLPTERGEPPLARAKNWKTKDGHPIELNTMPGFAGSSAYYLRYMDPHNDQALVSKENNEYWRDVDLYIGGTEHATGHLIYSRFWNKFLYDLGYVCEDEPFKKLINQGMIQGSTPIAKTIIYEPKGEDATWIILPKSAKVKKGQTQDFIILSERIPLNYVNIRNNEYILTQENLIKLKNEHKHFKNHTLATPQNIEILQKIVPDRDYLNIESFKKDLNSDYVILDSQIEKMSKAYFNVVNPDDVIEKYGADTLRMYEMFLGPIDVSKPWDTHGIEGVFRFLRKMWSLFFDNNGNFIVSADEPSADELKIIHKTIKKVQEDILRFSFNTSVSAFMICVNELTDIKCHKRKVLEDLVVILSPFAPHICEELWEKLGHEQSVSFAAYPEYNEEYLVENTFTYPVSFNGKLRFKLELSVDMANEDIEKAVLEADEAQKWLEGKPPKRIIIVPKKIINVVV